MNQLTMVGHFMRGKNKLCRLTSLMRSKNDPTTLLRFCERCHRRTGVAISINTIGKISRIDSSNNREKSNPPRHDPASIRNVLSRSRHEGPEERVDVMSTLEPPGDKGWLKRRKTQNERHGELEIQKSVWFEQTCIMGTMRLLA